jgi:hypothetical protein
MADNLKQPPLPKPKSEENKILNREWAAIAFFLIAIAALFFIALA